MREYFLTSKRLGFGRWAEEDVALALGLWGDPEVTRFTGGRLTELQVRERLTREIDTLERYRVQYWPLFLQESGEHIGCCGLRPPRREAANVYEFGFQLRTVYWRRGFAREAAGAIIPYAFDMLGAQALRAGHHPANEVSRHLLHTLGFRYTHDEIYPPTGLLEPCYRLAR